MMYIYIVIHLVIILGYLGCKFILIYIRLTYELVYLNLKHASADKWNMLVEYKTPKE